MHRDSQSVLCKNVFSNWLFLIHFREYTYDSVTKSYQLLNGFGLDYIMPRLWFRCHESSRYLYTLFENCDFVRLVMCAFVIFDKCTFVMFDVKFRHIFFRIETHLVIYFAERLKTGNSFEINIRHELTIWAV